MRLVTRKRVVLILFVVSCAVFAGSKFGPGSRAAKPKAVVLGGPIVSATMTAAAATDVGGNGAFVNPGDTLRYTATISNAGDAATGVVFTDNIIDPSLTLVPGSIRATPIAGDDVYPVTGNVKIQKAAGTLFANDVSPLNNTFTITQIGTDNSAPFSFTTTNGGTVTATTGDGSFEYDPAAGFEGSGVGAGDTFTYVITDSQGQTGTGTVRLDVSGMIWFVNNSAPACTTLAAGCGRLTTPFSSLAAFATLNTSAGNNPGDNDSIFIYNTGVDYVSGLALRNGQRLIGQGASDTLANVSGITFAADSITLPTTTPGTRPTITNAAGGGIIANTVGGTNLIRGITYGAVVNGNATKLGGAGFGTITIGNNVAPDVELVGPGRAIDFINGSFAATSGLIGTTSTGGGTNGINLNNVGGTINFGPTTIGTTTAQGIQIAGSTVAATFGTTQITSPTTQGILIGTSTGNIAFGATTITGGTDAISLQNNSAGSRTFASVSTTNNSGVGFLRSLDGGAMGVTGATTITNPGGNGIQISGCTAAATFGNTNSTQSGSAGVILSGNSGAVTFADLDISPDANMPGLVLLNNTATTSTTSGTINTPGSSAIGITSSPVNMVFDSVTASGGTTPGVNLVTATGSLTMNAGTLTGHASSPTFLVFGGTISTSYVGNITQANNAAAVSVTNGHDNPVAGSGSLFFTGTINATNGTGLQFDNADGAYNFNGTQTLNGGDAGIDIFNGSAGTFVFNGNTSINNPSGIAYREDTSTAGISYFGTITKTNNAANAVDINAKTGGTTAFAGAITGTTTTANAIDLTGNTGGTINFTGGLNLTTTSGVGFNATSGGTISATQNNTSIVNTISSGTGTALNVANTNIGANNLEFRSISAGTAAATTGVGINLDTTGSVGGLHVTGTGTADSGGTIRFKGTAGTANGSTTDGVGINLNDTDEVQLRYMQLNDHTNYAIRGNNVIGLVMDDLDITGFNGSEANGATQEYAVNLTAVTGTVNITDTEVSGGFLGNVRLDNQSGTTNLNFLNNNIHNTRDDPLTSGDGFNLEAETNAVFFANVSNNIFNNNEGDDFNLSLINSANFDLTCNNNDIDGDPNKLSGGIFILGASYNGTFKYDISNNNLQGTNQGGAIHVNKGSGTAVYSGRIVDNVIGNPAVNHSGSLEASGIIIGARGASGSHTTLVHSNEVYQYHDRGIILEAGEGSPTLVATVTSNTVSTPADPALNSLHGIHFDLGILAADNAQITVDARANLIANAGAEGVGGVDFRMRTASLNDTFIAGCNTCTTAAATQTFIDGQNPDGTSFNISQAGSGTYNNGPASPLPPPNLPTLPPAPRPKSFDGATSQLEISPANIEMASVLVEKAYGSLKTPRIFLETQRTSSEMPRGLFETPAEIVETSTALSEMAPVNLEMSPRDLEKALRESEIALWKPAKPVWDVKKSLAKSAIRPAEPEIASAVGAGGSAESAIGPAETANEPSMLAILSEFAAKAVSEISPTVYSQEVQSSAFRLSSDEAKEPSKDGTLSPEGGGTVMVNGAGSGFTIPQGKSTTITFETAIAPVGTISPTAFSVTNQGQVSGSNFATINTDGDPGTGGAQPTVTTIVQPPTITKSFSPTSVMSGAPSTMTLTVNNANPGTAVTAITFTDVFPNQPNLVVATPANASTTCTGGTLQDQNGGTLDPGDTGIKLVGGTLAAAQSCTVTVDVSSTVAGSYVNTTGAVSSFEGATGLTATATLDVAAGGPDIVVKDASGPEPPSGSRDMPFTVILSSPAPAGGVAVNFTTADEPVGPGKAVAGSDYTTTSGTVNFAAGQSVQTIGVPILSDATPGEPNETFLLNLTGATGGTITDAQAIGTITAGNPAGTVLISELRTFGPAGAAGDDFVEIYNNSDAPLTVAASDASAGYGLFKKGATCNDTPILIGTIPNGTVIPARGHYLFTGSTYSLAAITPGNLTMSSDLENNVNVGIFSTSDLLNLSTGTRLDAVGFVLNGAFNNCGLLREASALPDVNAAAVGLAQHSYHRDACSYAGGMGCPSPAGRFPVDTNINLADFRFADTNATDATGVGQRLGTPGPENVASDTSGSGNTVPTFRLDGNETAFEAPNLVRNVSDTGTNQTFGTLSIRARFTNGTGANLTHLRFRIIEETTFMRPNGTTADLRALTSGAVSVPSVTDPATCAANGVPATPPCTVMVQGTTLDMPTQPLGGGYNSTLSAGTVTLGTPLADGASISLQFKLGVEQTGNYRFYIVTETLPGGGSSVNYYQGNTETQPTAAGVSVSGRVLTAEGRAVRNAMVVLTDDTGATRTVIAGPRGNYRFDDVEAGRTYIISVNSRRFTFAPRVLTVSDELTDVDMVAEQ